MYPVWPLGLGVHTVHPKATPSVASKTWSLN